jgi:hypothetical protein
MWDGYVNAAKEFADTHPEVSLDVVTDRYHVAKNYRDCVDTVRKSKCRRLKKELPKANHADVKGMMWIVRKNHRDLTPEERERFRHYLQTSYDTFIGQVADGRGLNGSTAQEAAQGRVWTGEQALELGLVDALGGLETAIATVKSILDIPEEDDVLLVAYPRPGNPFEILRQRFGGLLHINEPKQLRTVQHQLNNFVRLQEEQVFAWWPARIFVQ